jgi:outer membrane lipoprotein-sorting protein
MGMANAIPLFIFNQMRIFPFFTLYLIFLCWLAVSAGVPKTSAVRPTSDNAAPLIDSVIAVQKKISSITCKYHHKRWLNNVGPSEYQGDISFLAPEKILMHFLYPADEYVLVNDSTVLIYGIKNAYGIRYLKKCLSPTEQQIAEQIGQIKMNMLQTMRSSYYFTCSDSADRTNIVISATPKNGWKSLSKIALVIDAQKKMFKGIALYGKEGNLVSSTQYSDFIAAGASGSFFPRMLTVTLNAGQTIQKDEITYSRIEFNKPLPKDHFSIPVAKNAEIIDNRADCK